MVRRPNQRGLTLIELVVAFSIMALLTSMAVPLARYLPLAGCHHLAAVDELGDAGSALFAAARGMLLA